MNKQYSSISVLEVAQLLHRLELVWELVEDGGRQLEVRLLVLLGEPFELGEVHELEVVKFPFALHIIEFHHLCKRPITYTNYVNRNWIV